MSSAQTSGAAFETDALRPSGLPSANLNYHNVSETVSSAKFLDDVEEDWNKRVDVEIEALVEGMTDLVELASITDKDKFRVSQDAFEAECRAENMVRAANSLLSITHSLKLMVLLSDEADIVARRERELAEIAADIENSRRKASAEWQRIVTQDDNGSQTS